MRGDRQTRPNHVWYPDAIWIALKLCYCVCRIRAGQCRGDCTEWTGRGVPAGGVPGQRQKVEHREEVDHRRDRQYEVASFDEFLGADFAFDGAIQTHQIVQLENGADLEEGKWPTSQHR